MAGKRCMGMQRLPATYLLKLNYLMASMFKQICTHLTSHSLIYTKLHKSLINLTN